MMKKPNGILTGLIAACAACVISAASFSQLNEPMAPLSVRYVVDGVDAAIGFHTTLTELTSVRYLIADARGAVDLYATISPSQPTSRPVLSSAGEQGP
jgi:hypothetical protein